MPPKASTFLDVASQFPVTRISSVNDVEEFHALNPNAAPREGAIRPVTWAYGDPEWGMHNGYSKYIAANITGEYMLVRIPNGIVGLYRLSDNAYLGELAASPTNAVNQVFEPRWDRSGLPGTETNVLYHIGQTLYKQNALLGYTSQQEVAELRHANQPVFVSGDEGDWDHYGRYFAFKFGTYDFTLGSYQNVVIGVYDQHRLGMLPGVIYGNPNAVDMSPTGKWLAILPHSSYTIEESNRFYRVTDLEQGITDRPVYVDSARVNNFQSIGHNGWGFDYQGNEVLVYQDNRDDWMKAFNPETGTSIKIYYMGDWGWDDLGFHIAGQKNPNFPGWFLYSSYSPAENPLPSGWDANQLMMVEIKPAAENPRVWRIANTQNAVRSFDSEAFASIDMNCEYVYWGGNWGATNNVETFRVKLPETWHADLTSGIELPPPPPAPTPTPFPTGGGLILNDPNYEVENFSLIDANTDLPIPDFDPIPDGAVIDIGNLGTANFNIRANPRDYGIGSMRFGFGGNPYFRIERFFPFALHGKSGWNFFDWRPVAGTYTVSATIYSDANAEGSYGPTKSLTFTMIGVARTTVGKWALQLE